MHTVRESWSVSLGRLASPKSAGEAGGLETQGRAQVAFQVRRLSAARIPSCLEKGQSLFYQCFSTASMGPAHIMKGNLLYSQFTDINGHLIQKTTSHIHI